MAQRERPEVFDRGVWVRSRWRAARRALIGLVLLVAFVEAYGVPEVRLVGPESGRVSVYYGVQGQRRAPGGGVSPLVVLRKLDRPVWDYALDLLER